MRRRRWLRGVGYWILAWSIPVSIALGYGVGWWLDRRFGTSPGLQIIGFLLGVVAGLTQLLEVAGEDDE